MKIGELLLSAFSNSAFMIVAFFVAFPLLAPALLWCLEAFFDTIRAFQDMMVGF